MLICPSRLHFRVPGRVGYLILTLVWAVFDFTTIPKKFFYVYVGRRCSEMTLGVFQAYRKNLFLFFEKPLPILARHRPMNSQGVFHV